MDNPKQERIDSFEEELSNLNALLTEKYDEIEVLKEQLKDKSMQLVEQESKIQCMEKDLLKKQENIDILEQEVSDLNAFIAIKSEDIELMIEKLDKQTINIVTQETKIEYMKEEIDYFKSKNMLLLAELKSTREAEKSDITLSDNQQNIIKEQVPTKDKNTQTDCLDDEKENQGQGKVSKEENMKSKAVGASNTRVVLGLKEVQSKK